MQHIEFEFVDKNHINVIVVGDETFDEKTGRWIKQPDRHEVGHIITQSTNGKDRVSKMSIQVCGFSEAFALWGCGLYQTPKYTQDGVGYETTKEITEPRHVIVDGKLTIPDFRDRVVTQKGGQIILEQVKDIQLMFRQETHPGVTEHHSFRDDCIRCFNKPCTCEIHVEGDNPYAVKSVQDLNVLTNEAEAKTNK